MKQIAKNKIKLLFNWKIVKIGNICKIQTGKKDVDEGNPHGKYPFFSCSRQITYSDTYSFDTEAILVAGNGDVGNTKIYKGKFEAYQRTYVLDKFKENIKYIYYYLLGNLKHILVRNKSGSTMPYIRKGDLENFQISYPEDKTEQQKIVYVLDCIQEAVEVQEKLIEKTKELKKSLMQKLFREGTRGAKLKKTEIGEIPNDWRTSKLQDSIELIIDHRGKTPKKLGGNWSSEGIPVLSAKNIKDGKIVNRNEIKYVDHRLYEKWMPEKLEAGDVLLTSEAPAGEVYCLQEKADYCLGQRIFALRPKKGLLYPAFLYWLLTSQIIQNQLVARLTGSTAKGIKQAELVNILLVIPSIEEQRKIAEILQTVDQKIEIEQKKKDLYEELFKTMLNKLMTGEIRVDNIEF